MIVPTPRNREFSPARFRLCENRTKYVYDPYGRAAVLDGNWQEISWPDSKRNEIRFTGHRFNPTTGTYHARNREYHPSLGRFMQRDPLGYVDGMSLYAGYFAMWGGVDPSGRNVLMRQIERLAQAVEPDDSLSHTFNLHRTIRRFLRINQIRNRAAQRILRSIKRNIARVNLEIELTVSRPCDQERDEVDVDLVARGSGAVDVLLGRATGFAEGGGQGTFSLSERAMLDGRLEACAGVNVSLGGTLQHGAELKGGGTVKPCLSTDGPFVKANIGWTLDLSATRLQWARWSFGGGEGICWGPGCPEPEREVESDRIPPPPVPGPRPDRSIADELDAEWERRMDRRGGQR